MENMEKQKRSITVETFKKMFKEKKIEIAKVKGLLNTKVITLDEYDYILGKKEV